LNALSAKYVLHIEVRARKMVCWQRIEIITLFPTTECNLMPSSTNVLCPRRWEIVGTYIMKLLVPTLWNCWYLHYEIQNSPVAMRHVQMLKCAATLSLFCLLMAIQLAAFVVLSYLKLVLCPSYL
jgi:hypothetical protein